jgi:proteasome accessory factor B
MTKPTKLQRWLDIIAYLVGRRLPVSVDELMRNVPAYADRWASGNESDHASARRGFERDKDELRAFGIPIRTVKYSINYGSEEREGYAIERRDFYLPYLRLVQQHGEIPLNSGYRERARPADVVIDEEEAPLALAALRRVADVPGFPLQREAKSAFRKLAFDLDPSAFAEGQPNVLFVDQPGAAELAARLRLLTDALLARKRVAFRYHGIHRDQATERSVDAYGLLFQHGHWYLVGHDHTRNGRRVFRVGRMEEIQPNGRAPGTPDYELPAGFRIDELAGRSAWDLGDAEEQAVTARVRFHFPLSLWAERNGHGLRVSVEPGGAELREFRVHQLNPFLRWLLSLETEVDLLEPAELRTELRRLAESVAQAHGSAGGEA